MRKQNTKMDSFILEKVSNSLCNHCRFTTILSVHISNAVQLFTYTRVHVPNSMKSFNLLWAFSESAHWALCTYLHSSKYSPQIWRVWI